MAQAAIEAAPGRETERAGTARLWRNLRGAPAAWLPALPLLLLIAVLLFAPAIWLIVQSLWTGDGLTLAQWSKTLGSRITHRAIVTSLELSALSATIATLVARRRRGASAACPGARVRPGWRC